MQELIGAEDVPAIARGAQIAAATERIDSLIHALPVPDRVLYYYGVPEIGKTTILRAIAQYIEAHNIVNAWIDFDRSILRENNQTNLYDGQNGRINIIKHLLEDISKTANFDLGDVTAADLDPQQYDIAAVRLLNFAREVYSSTGQRPFVLFFDTIEDSDLDLFIWLQNQVLEVFVKEFRTLIIIASRTHPNKIGRDLIYPLERRAVKIALEPFDADQTEQQIRAIGAQQLQGIGDELKRVTNGLPGLNDAAVRRLVEETRRQPDQDLRRYLIVELIFEKRVAQVGADPQLQQQLLAIAPLRQFDAVLLRAIGSKLFLGSYDFSRVRTLIDILQKFQRTRLVEPHPDRYGYSMPRHIRLMIDEYVRETNPIEHFDVHRIAAEHFKAQVANRHWVSIANRIYHLGGLQRDLHLASPEMRELLLARLDDELLSKSLDFQFIAEELQKTLQQLSDVDQAHAFDLTINIRRILNETEFREILGNETVERLIEICDHAIGR